MGGMRLFGAHRLGVAEIRRHRCQVHALPAPEVGEVGAVLHRTDGVAGEPADRSGTLTPGPTPASVTMGRDHLGVAGLATLSCR